MVILFKFHFYHEDPQKARSLVIEKKLGVNAEECKNYKRKPKRKLVYL